MIIERIKKTFEFQRSRIHGPVPLWGVLNGIFILYPLVFLGFWAVGGEVLKDSFLHQVLVIVGAVIWILNLFFLLDYKRGILTSFGTYLMYLSGYVYTVIDFSAMSEDYNFIGVKLSLPFIYAIVSVIVMSCLVDLNSKEIMSEKAGKVMLYFVVSPPLILSCFFVLLGVLGYDYFWGWGMSLFLMISGTFLYLTWFIIIYAYKHRNDIKFPQNISSLGVPSEFIKNQKFDKNKFKKK